ncbi:MAG: hypoxanthine phosphoribosyltransferase [Bacteroidetes bacterium]|nr:hypoxanthine phosphoribosyltransferase [Bacteroidota bacterium]
MEKTITLGDKSFRLYITEQQIRAAVKQIADKINTDYAGKTPLIVPILNGSFMFASDLVKELTCHCEISFIKASSYRGTASTGELTSLIGINEDVRGRDIILVEDIIDTGHTLAKIVPSTEALGPASVKVATLLFKPKALKTDLRIDYVGLEIPNEFIVGYGLDYDGLGRNLKEIYQVIG